MTQKNRTLNAIFVPNEGREPLLYLGVPDSSLSQSGTYHIEPQGDSSILKVNVNGQRIEHHAVRPTVLGLNPYDSGLVAATAKSVGFSFDKIASIVGYCNPRETPESFSFGASLEHCQRAIARRVDRRLVEKTYDRKLASGTAALRRIE